MCLCVCVYLCYGVYVLYTDWLVKQPNKATVSQTQSTNHQYHPFKAQDPLPHTPPPPKDHWAWALSKARIHTISSIKLFVTFTSFQLFFPLFHLCTLFLFLFLNNFSSLHFSHNSPSSSPTTHINCHCHHPKLQ